MIRSLPPIRLEGLSNRELVDYFTNTWELYELLFSSVRSDDSLLVNPDPLRHPLIFYLGHTAVFYLNKLKIAGVIDRGFDDHFEQLFEMGVDPERPEDLPSFPWPTVESVREYRRRVYDFLVEHLSSVDIPERVTPGDDEMWALLMGLEHDRIHFETSSVLIRQYPAAALTRPEGWEYAPVAITAETNGSPIPVGPGRVRLGKPPDVPTFGWDNEYGERPVEVAPFAAMPHLVTNAEFGEFVDDGGYAERALWSEEGWSWKERSAATHPRFWVPVDGGFRYRAMFDEIELPAAWPVEVNAHEAHAYCRWRGPQWRLPTEAEFARMTADAPLADGDSVFAGCYNLNLAFGSPSPVGLLANGATGRGFHDAYGNVWQWLSDDFTPLPGFETHYLYRDFSEPFFDEQHSMLLGGSWASTGTSASRFYRLWFRRDFYQHAGFRLATDLDD